MDKPLYHLPCIAILYTNRSTNYRIYIYRSSFCHLYYLWSPKSLMMHPIMGNANNDSKYQIHKIILSILSPFAPTPQSVVFHRQSTNFGGHGCPVKTALFYLRILSHIKLASRPLIVYKTIHIKKLFILSPLL